MRTPTAAQAEPTSPSAIVARTIKAYCGAYDISRDAFALGAGFNPRTFARRLDTLKFEITEVGRIADYMTRMGPNEVTIEDLYSGRLNVAGATERDPRPDGPGGGETRTQSRGNAQPFAYLDAAAA